MKKINFLYVCMIILLALTICTSCGIAISPESLVDGSSTSTSKVSSNTTSHLVGINIGNDDVSINIPGINISAGNDGVNLNVRDIDLNAGDFGVTINGIDGNNYYNSMSMNVNNFTLSRDIFNKTLNINTFKSTLSYSSELSTTDPNAQDIVINAAGVFIVFEKSNDDFIHFNLSTTTESEFLKYDFSIKETSNNVTINAKPKSEKMKNLNINNRLLTIALPDKELNRMTLNLAFTSGAISPIKVKDLKLESSFSSLYEHGNDLENMNINASFSKIITEDNDLQNAEINSSYSDLTNTFNSVDDFSLNNSFGNPNISFTNTPKVCDINNSFGNIALNLDNPKDFSISVKGDLNQITMPNEWKNQSNNKYNFIYSEGSSQNNIKITSDMGTIAVNIK